MENPGQPAVWIRDAYKSYGSGRKAIPVLKALNMTVQQGTIYGLLGPSGCGKTTLLRCIVGRMRLDHGRVVVLGDRPGSPGHGIPGNMVGYMPQELALYEAFTIGDTLRFFGRLHNMKSSEVQKRTRFLLELLTLPDESRMVKNLSGGQKRRVSFATALLQEPQLLILDEPTVGVDPLLRERIWKHMIDIAKNNQRTTIIITTHYIEEARQANKVGLMRNGRLLAEESPTALIQRHNLPSLEDVFLTLCAHDEPLDVDVGQSSRRGNKSEASLVEERQPLLSNKTGRQRKASNDSLSIQDPSFKIDSDADVLCHKSAFCNLGFPVVRNVLAQVIKNFTVMKRNLGVLLFQFILPVVQINLFCLCIGGNAYNLQVAVVNHDQGFLNVSLGSMYLSYVDNTSILQKSFDNLTAAKLSVERGDSWAVIALGQNYSRDLYTRFMSTKHIDNKTMDGGDIHLYQDKTNQQISLIIQEKVALAFTEFIEKLLSTYAPWKNPEIADLPIKNENPIYGEEHPSFTNFMAPGVIISVTFFLAVGLTTLSFVTEKKEGLLDRSMVAGVTSSEVMLAHICTQVVIMVVQVSLLLVFALAVYNVPYKGPLIWVVLLVLLQGFCGMDLGMIFSSLCEKETTAIQMALGIVYPLLLLSGIIWPIEAMPDWLRYISVSLPMTYAAEAMRSVLGRGWDITWMVVWRGYAVTAGWSFGLLIISAIILKIKS